MNFIGKLTIKSNQSQLTSVALLVVFILFTSCGRSVKQIVEDVNVSPTAYPIDLSDKLMVTLPPGFPQKDYNTFLETLPIELQRYGFEEIWDTDYHEMELKSVGIHDFTTERNQQKLYKDLGVRYLLDLEILDKKPIRISKLGATMRYNEINNNSPFVHSTSWVEGDYWIITRYKLYDLVHDEVIIEMQIKTSHNINHTVNSKSLKKDLQKLFEFIYTLQ
ncbi:hypothetical protein SAMN06295967_11910 [Belliella buryatensis]|uniref:Lipoprotein n=1 Tax=Belliella buryatensis TaxID=1500549 RepID=A0A239GTI1_9BACT|nr:hypothetical protein [Belliella buryatensis]SNS72281.1 hypothetical protein SAMN06295967_11910 [Belliella buryatensis]